MPINYHNRVFKSVNNTGNGEVDAATTFYYQQSENVVSAIYQGGSILYGNLIAKVDENGGLDMRYQHLNISGELMTGKCQSVPELLPDGRIRLHETWQWTSGDQSAGQSVIEEVG